jgi:hypothetical protein
MMILNGRYLSPHATISASGLGTIESMVEWRWFDLEAIIYGDALTPRRGRIPVLHGPGLGPEPYPHVLRVYLRTDAMAGAYEIIEHSDDVGGRTWR